ncbi:MAG: hypothetical protein FGM57_03445 [Candidatus Taylorbacteria bacterium]|nr:hypothetical protein [Candidatus Taylorbacteria bacterium]
MNQFFQYIIPAVGIVSVSMFCIWCTHRTKKLDKEAKQVFARIQFAINNPVYKAVLDSKTYAFCILVLSRFRNRDVLNSMLLPIQSAEDRIVGSDRFSVTKDGLRCANELIHRTGERTEGLVVLSRTPVFPVSDAKVHTISYRIWLDIHIDVETDHWLVWVRVSRWASLYESALAKRIASTINGHSPWTAIMSFNNDMLNLRRD